MPGLIGRVVREEREKEKEAKSGVGGVTRVEPTGGVYVGRAESEELKGWDCVVVCCEEKGMAMATQLDGETKGNGKNILRLNCGTAKIGSRNLRTELSKVPTFITAHASSLTTPKMLFVCPTGTDLAIGVALVVLCLFYDEEGTPLAQSPNSPPLLHHPHQKAELTSRSQNQVRTPVRSRPSTSTNVS